MKKWLFLSPNEASKLSDSKTEILNSRKLYPKAREEQPQIHLSTTEPEAPFCSKQLLRALGLGVFAVHSTTPLLIHLELHCLFKSFPKLFQLFSSSWQPHISLKWCHDCYLVAPICTASILFHTGNVWKYVSQEQNFFSFLSYSSHMREKKEEI